MSTKTILGKALNSLDEAKKKLERARKDTDDDYEIRNALKEIEDAEYEITRAMRDVPET